MSATAAATTEPTTEAVASEASPLTDTRSRAITQSYDEILGGFRSILADTPIPPQENQSATTNADGLQREPQKPLEVKRVIQFPESNWDKDNYHVVSADGYQRKKPKRDPNENFKDYPILLRRVLNYWGRLLEVRLEIQSEGLRKAFQDIGRPFRCEVNIDASPIVIQKPFRLLFFLRERLEELEKSEDLPVRTKQELGLVLDFINSKEGLQDTIKTYQEQVLMGKVSFRLLWTMFAPRELVYLRDHRHDECCYIRNMNYGFGEGGIEYLTLNILSGDHNGVKFGIKGGSIAIPSFPGWTDIQPQNLPLIPLKYFSELEQMEIRTRLTERGKKYVALQSKNFSHLSYEGPFWGLSSEKERFMLSVETSQRVQVNGRVVIDALALNRLNLHNLGSFIAPHLEKLFPSSDSESRPPSQAEKVKLGYVLYLPDKLRQKNEDITNEEYMICPTRIYGFLLAEKAWGAFEVSELNDIDWESEAFNYLQLEPEKKDLVGELVRSFNGDDEVAGFDDVVEGKGKGLVFLLHGAPGLGKTMTAESVAEHTQKPLYHVTTGELSTDVPTMEKQLRQIFELGWRWRAVVLLDEADVLMSERSLHELDRSAIVAVFLRLIEYYKGLLFLTTNRVEGFDKAFYNRIHVTIKYEILNPKSRRNIWNNLLTKQRFKPPLDQSWSDATYDVLGELPNNGRDIRNTIRTAYGISKAQGVDLGVKHILAVLRNNFPGEKLESIAQKLQGLTVQGGCAGSDVPSVKENVYPRERNEKEPLT